MSNEQPTTAFAIASKAERTLFIGAFVRPEVKEHLTSVAKNAPGGARNYNWAINKILEDHLTANSVEENNDNGNETK